MGCSPTSTPGRLFTWRRRDKAGADGDARELRKYRQDLETKETTAKLERFYDDVKTRWGDIELHNIRHVHYSPSISVDVEGEQYTEDWSTFHLEEAKFKGPVQLQRSWFGCVLTHLSHIYLL